MAPIPHLTQQLKGTTAELETLASANNLVAEHFYFSTTNNRYYYAATSSILIGPIDEGSMPTFTDTPTITHTDNGSGDFEFDVKIDPASNNVLTSTQDGLIVPDIAIATGSQQYLTYDAGTRELSVKQLLFSSVTVDETHETLAAFIAAEYTQGDEFQEGDSVILTEAENKEIWIHNGGTAGTAADFTKINANHLDDEYIRTLLSGGDGIDYNANTGEISINLNSPADNALSFNNGALYLSTTVSMLSNGIGNPTPLRFGDLLRVQGTDLLNVSMPSSSGNQRSFDLSWDTSGATAGQVATFDGTNVIWDDVQAGTELEHWEEDYHDTGVNDTRTVSSWSAKGAATNIDAVIQPKGTGALALQVAGVGAAGDKRGIYAIDFQRERSAANQVASGNYSSIIGGSNNRASANFSVVMGGDGNIASGLYSIAAGLTSQATHAGSLVFSDSDASSANIASTQSHEAILAYKNRIFLRTDLAEISGQLEIDTVNQDNGLEEILAVDGNGRVHRRAIGTFPGASGSSNIYNTSGELDGNRNLDMAGFTLTFRDSSDNPAVRFSESGSTIRAMIGDIEVDNSANGLVLKSANGTRYRITVANAGFLRTEAL